MKTTFKVEGLKELGESMRLMEAETSKRIAWAMTSAAAKVVRDAAIINAPDSEEPHTVDGVLVQPGNLKRNIVQRKIGKTTLTAEHIVTVRGKRKDGYAARYGRLQEFGTVHHAPQPFLKPAIDHNITRAINAMKTTGERRVISAAKRAAKGKK